MLPVLLREPLEQWQNQKMLLLMQSEKKWWLL
jgi:hypothetical protein